VIQKDAKKLETATENKTVAGETKLPQSINGIIALLLAYLEREGYSLDSKYPQYIKKLAKLGANLYDPESIKTTIAKQPVKDGTKMQIVAAYDILTKILKLQWTPPHYSQEEIIPFIPYEEELDCLISASRSKRFAAYLQALKETFGDPSEVLGLRWIDISGNIITINKPVKGHLPRQLEVSNKLLAMLNSLPKTDERIFPTTYNSVLCTYVKLRKRAAELQKNPRLLSIELRTFRHWGGTMIAQYTNGNILIVKRLLGHKRVENSMKYIGMLNFKDSDFEETTATTPDEIRALGKAGWTKYDEMTFNGIQMHFYRRNKRFGKVTGINADVDG